MNKKKYPGGLKVLLLPLFIMLLGMFSTCYARTTLTDEEAEYLWNYFFNDTYNTDVVQNNMCNFYISSLGSRAKAGHTSYDSTFKTYFNEHNTLEISENTYFINIWFANNGSVVAWFNFENTASGLDNLPYLYLEFESSNSNKVTLYAIDDSKNKLSISCQKFDIANIFSSERTYTSFSTNYSIPSTGKVVYLHKSGWNSNNEKYTTILNPISGFTNFARLPISIVYSNYNGVSFSDTPTSYFYKNLYNTSSSIPDDPSNPDNPSDTGNTGTITDNNGDTTGQIDLSGIQNGLGNINQSINTQGQTIIDNQNENTQAIIDNQNLIAQQQHNDLTNYDVEDGEDDVNGLIDNISSSLSGDLSNSEIFGALEESEQGFLNLISGQAEDFEIHWNDVFYNGVKLIPAGQVNFSKMCRENSALGNIKEKLNIILSALCALALIRYLYNLLLATLGIDNPYLYDNNSDSDYIKTVDKNTGITTYSGVDKDGTRWRFRYDPKASNSKKGGKNK